MISPAKDPVVTSALSASSSNPSSSPERILPANDGFDVNRRLDSNLAKMLGYFIFKHLINIGLQVTPYYRAEL